MMVGGSDDGTSDTSMTVVFSDECVCPQSGWRNRSKTRAVWQPGQISLKDVTG